LVQKTVYSKVTKKNSGFGFWRTLKKALASDCDEMGVQFNIGRRTLLAATRRLNDGLPSEIKFGF